MFYTQVLFCIRLFFCWSVYGPDNWDIRKLCSDQQRHYTQISGVNNYNFFV